MKVGFPGGPRLEWYDRNAIARSLYYTGSGIAPHGLTVRAQYTIPTGKKAHIGALHGLSYRTLAASTPGHVTIYLYIHTSVLLLIHQHGGTIGDHSSDGVNAGAVVLAGQTISIQTWDVSGDGQMNYAALVAIMEFDA